MVEQAIAAMRDDVILFLSSPDWAPFAGSLIFRYAADYYEILLF